MSVVTHSGVPGLGTIGWGAHFCHFYESAQDLADTLVPFFRAGLENNEACLWVACEPYTAAMARSELRMVVPDLDDREADGQIEIVDHDEWYLKVGKRDPRTTLEGWLDREAAALRRGYAGLRLTGNTYWLERDDWDSFVEYEMLVNDAFRRHRIVALCSYCLQRCMPKDVLDVVRNHQFTVSRRGDSWDVLESATLKLARQDLQRLQESERQLREADRRKDEFLAMLAHELRNPLAPIRSGIDALVLAGENQQILGLMQQQVEHLVRLVDDLLDVSRIMRDRIELRREPIELATLVNRAVETMRTTISEEEQQLVVTMPANPIRIDADPVRVVQVISNLLSNASRYTPPRGRIEIEASTGDGNAAITVRDNGIGMSSDLLPRVFELFLQGDQTIDRPHGGLGIGLTLVQRLVELHGGSVSAHSDGPGQGSEFTVRLPLGSPQQDAPQDSAGSPEVPASRRVLVVDDNSGAARMLAMLIEKLSRCEVQTAADGPAGLEALRTFRPHLVLLDLGLPGIDGYEVARRIRSLPEGQDVLLVAVTGYGQEEDRHMAIAAGFDQHFVKPLGLDQLLKVLSHSKLSD